tara:strand:- start:502 stop:900 length:399 start_codon:yes stop_codon:yes gene_type:complete
MRIQVSRDKGRFGRFRKLELHVDDEHLFDIKAGEAMIIDIPPNAKTIHGKMDWLETNLLSLENIRAGEQIKIEELSAQEEPSAQIDGRRSVASILRSVFSPEVPDMKSLPMRLSRDEEEETTSYLGNRQERT